MSSSLASRTQKCFSESPERQAGLVDLSAKRTSADSSSSSGVFIKENNHKFSSSDLYDYTNEAFKTPDITRSDEVFDNLDQNFDGMLYTDSDNFNQTLKILNALRKNRQLCDLILQLDNDTRDIYCHQIILACNSKFFMEIFTNYELEQSTSQLNESTEDLKEENGLKMEESEHEKKLKQIRKKSLQTLVNKNVNSSQRQLVFCLSGFLKYFLKDTNHHHFAKMNTAINHNSPFHHHYNHKNKSVDPSSSTHEDKSKQFNNNMDYEALKICIDYMYTSKLRVPSYLIPHVYTLAYHLSFNSIVSACGQHLAKNLCVDNCLSIRSFALDEKLIQASTQCIETNIEYILELKPGISSTHSSGNDLISQEFIKESNCKSSINLANKEFNNLPRISIELVGIKRNKAKLPENIVNLTQMCMKWLICQLSEKINCDFNYLCDNLNMLYMNANDQTLHDCCFMDCSDTNYTDYINDYQKMHNQSIDSNQSSTGKSFQHQLSTGSNSKLKTFKITDQELSAIGNGTPIKFKVLHDNEIICTHQINEHTFITICTLTGKLVTLSVHLLHTNESSSDSDSKPEIRSESKTSLNNDTEPMASMDHFCQSNEKEYERLAKMKLARCSHGVIGYENKLYIIGGYERGECLNLCEVYDPKKNIMEEIKPMQNRRGRAAVTFLEKTKSIYVMGGSDGHEDLNSIETFDLEKKTWKLTKFDLELGFTNLAAIGCDKYIYLVGLKADSSSNRSRTCCLRYEPEINEFTRIAELNYGRSQSALIWTTLPKDEFVLFVFGGNDSMRCLASCEIYSVRDDRWIPIANMFEPRRSAGAAVHKKSQMIYVVGGTNGTQSLKSIEIYDIKSKKWKIGPELNIARNNVTVEFIGDILFAIGGFDGKSFLKTIEYLNCNNLDQGWSMYHKYNDFDFLRN